MKSFQKSGIFRKNAAIILSGAAAGCLNGFLGSGGGIILLYVFRRLNRGRKDGEKDAFASVVAAVLPLCAVSAVVYNGKGIGNAAEELYRYILPAAAGGMLGAYLTDRLNTGTLRKIFAFVVILAGINMII